MDSPVSARCAVLQVLRQRASYAAAIIEQVYADTSQRILLRDSSIYPLLKRLQAEGLVTECATAESRPGVLGSQGGYLGRSVRMFSLTAEGRQEAEADAAAILALLGVAAEKVPPAPAEAAG